MPFPGVLHLLHDEVELSGRDGVSLGDGGIHARPRVVQIDFRLFKASEAGDGFSGGSRGR